MWQDVVAEMMHGGRRVDPMLLEATADQAHARAGRPRGLDFVRTIEELAEAHGVRIAYDPGFPTGHHGLVVGNTIVLARGMKEPLRVATGGHELSHILETRHRWDALHGDTWEQALMLAWPLSAIRAGEGPVLAYPAELMVYRAKMPAARRLLRLQGRLDDFV